MRHGETCWPVDPENLDALRQAIAHLENYREETARIGRNARRLVEEAYSSRRFGEGLAERLSGLCSGAVEPVAAVGA
jgi:glycosyltransferase involved in cell wall biosynthesis